MTKTSKVYTGKSGCLVTLAVIAINAVVILLVSVVLMFGWNLSAPALLGWQVLTFPMAFGIVLVATVAKNVLRAFVSRD